MPVDRSVAPDLDALEASVVRRVEHWRRADPSTDPCVVLEGVEALALLAAARELEAARTQGRLLPEGQRLVEVGQFTYEGRNYGWEQARTSWGRSNVTLYRLVAAPADSEADRREETDGGPVR